MKKLIYNAYCLIWIFCTNLIFFSRNIFIKNNTLDNLNETILNSKHIINKLGTKNIKSNTKYIKNYQYLIENKNKDLTSQAITYKKKNAKSEKLELQINFYRYRKQILEYIILHRNPNSLCLNLLKNTYIKKQILTDREIKNNYLGLKLLFSNQKFLTLNKDISSYYKHIQYSIFKNYFLYFYNYLSQNLDNISKIKIYAQEEKLVNINENKLSPVYINSPRRLTYLETQTDYDKKFIVDIFILPKIKNETIAPSSFLNFLYESYRSRNKINKYNTFKLNKSKLESSIMFNKETRNESEKQPETIDFFAWTPDEYREILSPLNDSINLNDLDISINSLQRKTLLLNAKTSGKQNVTLYFPVNPNNVLGILELYYLDFTNSIKSIKVKADNLVNFTILKADDNDFPGFFLRALAFIHLVELVYGLVEIINIKSCDAHLKSQAIFPPLARIIRAIIMLAFVTLGVLYKLAGEDDTLFIKIYFIASNIITTNHIELYQAISSDYLRYMGSKKLLDMTRFYYILGMFSELVRYFIEPSRYFVLFFLGSSAVLSFIAITIITQVIGLQLEIANSFISVVDPATPYMYQLLTHISARYDKLIFELLLYITLDFLNQMYSKESKLPIETFALICSGLRLYTEFQHDSYDLLIPKRDDENITEAAPTSN